jgi:hypothetical protein
MTRLRVAVLAFVFGVVLTECLQTRQLNQSLVMRPVPIRLDRLLHYVAAEAFQYRGQTALCVVDAAPGHGLPVRKADC